MNFGEFNWLFVEHGVIGSNLQGHSIGQPIAKFPHQEFYMALLESL